MNVEHAAGSYASRRAARRAGTSALLLAWTITWAACAGTDSPAPPDTPAPRVGPLWIAGSGGALPLARKLARAFEARRGAIRVVVHPSIGSSGAVRALGDRAIDVGLMTRAARDAERRLLSRVLPIADTHIVLAAHPDVGVTRIDRSQIAGLFSGHERWPGGLRAIPVLRETGDSSQEALQSAVPGLGATIDRMWREERYRVVWHDAELIETVREVPGAFGVSDDGQNRCEPGGARLVEIGGERLPKRIYLALAPEPRSEAEAFVAFATSDEGRAITRECGYTIPGEGR